MDATMSPAAHQAWPDREKQAIGRHKVRATRSDERCPARLPAVLALPRCFSDQTSRLLRWTQPPRSR